MSLQQIKALASTGDVKVDMILEILRRDLNYALKNIQDNLLSRDREDFDFSGKVTPVNGDLFVIEDSEDAFNKKTLSIEDLLAIIP